MLVDIPVIERSHDHVASGGVRVGLLALRHR